MPQISPREIGLVETGDEARSLTKTGILKIGFKEVGLVQIGFAEIDC